MIRQIMLEACADCYATTLPVEPAIRSFGHRMSTCWQIQPAHVNVDMQLGLSSTSSVQYDWLR